MFEILTLDNETIVRLIGNLRQFAAESGCDRRDTTYVVYNDALLNVSHLTADPSLAAKIINRHRTITRVTLPFAADSVLTKTNARVFGLRFRKGRLATAKILMRHSGKTFATRRYANTLFAEIHARHLAAPALLDAGPIFAPEIYAYDKQRGRWLVEQFVAGKPAMRRELALFAPHIDGAKIYAKTARPKPIFRRVWPRIWAGWLSSIDPDFPLPSERDLWPEALIHSDLAGNMHHTPDGRLCVLDWELARVSPVANDLASLYFLNPDLKLGLLDWLRRLDPSGDAVKPEIQIGIALMRYASDIMQNPMQYASDLVKERRIGYERAQAKLRQNKNEIRQYLSFLRKP